MSNIGNFKKYILGQEFVFRTQIFKGKFTLVKVKERKLKYVVEDYYSRYDTKYDITVNLNECQWWSVANFWHSPPKGFRRGKIVANKQLRVIIEREVKSMMSFINDDSRIGDITIKWLHENQDLNM
jgi:hypothetical protein